MTARLAFLSVAVLLLLAGPALALPYPSTVTTTTWVSVPGTHVVGFKATDGAGNPAEWRYVHFTIFATTKLTSYLTSPTVTLGKNTIIYGYLSSTIPMPLGQPVRIEKLDAGKWVYCNTVKTFKTAYGAKYQLSFFPKVTTSYRAHYIGDGGAFRGTVSTARKVTVKSKTGVIILAVVAGMALLGAAAYAVKERLAA